MGRELSRNLNTKGKNHGPLAGLLSIVIDKLNGHIQVIGSLSEQADAVVRQIMA